MTLLGKSWTADTLRAELAAIEKQKDADVLEVTRTLKAQRNFRVSAIRAEYRSRKKRLIVALDVLLAESSADGPTPQTEAVAETQATT